MDKGIQYDINTVVNGYRDTLGHRYIGVWIRKYTTQKVKKKQNKKITKNNGVDLFLPEIQDGLVFTP